MVHLYTPHDALAGQGSFARLGMSMERRWAAPREVARMSRHLSALWPLSFVVMLLLAIALVGPRMLGILGPPKVVAGPTPAAATVPGSPGAGPPQAAATSGKLAQRIVLGYYVPYDPTSWASFQAEAADLDYVDAQWVTADACGNIGSRDDRTLIAYANEHGVKVLPSLLASSGWVNHRLLTDPSTTDHFLNEIVSYVSEMGYPGFDLDMEGIDAGDRDAYSNFVAALADALHAHDKMLTLAIPAKTSDVRTGWGGPYDYRALGAHADLVLLMTYDYSWASGPPGSIAPQEWVGKVAKYAVSQIPPQKVLIGLAFYGYDWNTTVGGKARALIYSQAAALAQQYGTRIVTDRASRSGRFSYVARAGDTVPPPPSLQPLHHDIVVRTPDQCPVPSPSATPRATGTPGPAPSPHPTLAPAPLQEHVVWLEDATSVEARLQIALQNDVRGVGAWRLGQEDPGVWPQLRTYQSGK